MHTQVAIIGAGPAGSLLAHLLHRAGIESVVIERQSREHVLSRIRAGVLEWGTVEVLRAAGLGARMDAEGHVHTETGIAYGNEHLFYFDIAKHVGSRFVSYGQTNIQADLYDAADAAGLRFEFEAADVAIHDPTSDHPAVTFTRHGEAVRVDCRQVVGCDGFHGPAKDAIPADVLHRYEKAYPFGWLGILSETPPLEHLVYANSERGFALCSQRNPMLSRYYVQCPLDDQVEDWSDDRFWDELLARLPESVGSQIVTGPSIEKSIAPLRSFVAEPMRWGNLFLAGDAAHIVPPTGAKGLNLAVSDVFYLSRALAAHYSAGDDHYLDCYSEMALRRVWASVRFSWWMTTLLHRFPDQADIDQRLQEAELALLETSERAQALLCEQYAGLPFEE
ncbi:MAG TPA: 4-hydroxybenzoate 3-monooxygenase [Ilumatobacter sp.]|nr:4-hydroxybenzoate 3-monooxygenase [Ilumatobacter sp.]